jgi:hypothetical protein
VHRLFGFIAPLLHFSVSSLNCYPPLPLLMTICRSFSLPVQRVLRCCVFVYWQSRILPMLLLLSIACTIHFIPTIFVLHIVYGLLNFLFPNPRFAWWSFLVVIFRGASHGCVRNQLLKVATPWPPIFAIS